MVTNKASIRAFCILLATAAALVLLPPAVAAEREGEPEAGPPSIPAIKVTESPVIDGLLDDACWQQASHMEGFWRERIDAPEHERTEAWLCYDSQAIYVAFRCHDSQPSAMRSRQKKRQGKMGTDDQVQFWLDVENTGQNFYSFRVNPAGTQYDQVPGGTSEKIEWKGDWRAATSIDEGGWSAEMEIPFSILRYPEGQDCFRFDFARYLGREEERSLWPACFARVFDMDNCARWTHITTPPVPFRYVLMPYMLSVTSEDEGDREPLTGGLDFKGTLPNGVVTLGTYHPDFSNIEDVVETIDFTYTERWLPDPRAFFQEGSDYFPWFNLFYSRRVEDFDLGAKAFGTVGSERFGLLDAHRRGDENHFAWKYAHLFGTHGILGFGGADRRVPGEPQNRVHVVNGSWGWRGVQRQRFAWANWHTSSTEGEGGDDQMIAYCLGEERQQGLGWSLGGEYTGPDFRADDGFVPETGVRSFWMNLRHQRTLDEGPLRWMDWAASFNKGHSQAGRRGSIQGQHKRAWRGGWSRGSVRTAASEMASTRLATGRGPAGTETICTTRERSPSSGGNGTTDRTTTTV